MTPDGLNFDAASKAKRSGAEEGSRRRASRLPAIRPRPIRTQINKPMVVALLFILVLYVTMVYGPIAAMLVEMFPTRIRYTSMSLPYHIGNGWFGGLLPTTAFALVAFKGDIYYGLWYPIIIALITVVIGALFVQGNQGQRHLRCRLTHCVRFTTKMPLAIAAFFISGGYRVERPRPRSYHFTKGILTPDRTSGETPCSTAKCTIWKTVSRPARRRSRLAKPAQPRIFAPGRRYAH